MAAPGTSHVWEQHFDAVTSVEAPRTARRRESSDPGTKRERHGLDIRISPPPHTRPSRGRPDSGDRKKHSALKASQRFSEESAGAPSFRQLAVHLLYEFANEMSVQLWTQVGEQLVVLHQRELAAEKQRSSVPTIVKACTDDCHDEQYLGADDFADTDIHAASSPKDASPVSAIAMGECVIGDDTPHDDHRNSLHVQFAATSGSGLVSRVSVESESLEIPVGCPDYVEPPEAQPPVLVRPPSTDPVDLAVPSALVPTVSSLHGSSAATSSALDVKVVDTASLENEEGERRNNGTAARRRPDRSMTTPTFTVTPAASDESGAPRSPRERWSSPLHPAPDVETPRGSHLVRTSQLSATGYFSLPASPRASGMPLSISPRGSEYFQTGSDPSHGHLKGSHSLGLPPAGGDSGHDEHLDPQWAMKRTVKAVMAVSKLNLPRGKDMMRLSGLSQGHDRMNYAARMNSGTVEWDDNLEDVRQIRRTDSDVSCASKRLSSAPASRRVSTASTNRPTGRVSLHDSRRPSLAASALASATLGEQDSQFFQASQFKVREYWEAKDEDELLTHKCFYSLQDDTGSAANSAVLKKMKLRKKLSSASVSSFDRRRMKLAKNQVPLHPDASIRMAWELMTLLLIGYDIIVLPLHFVGPLHGLFTLTVTWFGRIIWTIDIIMSFMTGTYVHGALEMRPLIVAKRYTMTWFTFDVTLVVQEWASMSADDSADGISFSPDNFSAVRSFRLLRFLRLLRLLKAGFMISDIIERFNSTSFVLFCDIVKSVFGLVIINHIVACLWYGIGDTDTGWVNFPANNIDDTSFVYRYLTSLHWSLTNFSGSTEIFPRTTSERFFSVIIVLLALILFSSFLGNLTNTMMELQELQHERHQQQRILRRFLRDNNISSMLSTRVKKYLLGIAVEDQRHGQVLKALATLPEQLLMDIHDESRGPLIAAHQFFCDLRQQHPRLLRQICHSAMTDCHPQANEAIFAVGDACGRMLFMMEGTVQYELKRTAQSPAGIKRKHTSDLSSALGPYRSVKTSSSSHDLGEMHNAIMGTKSIHTLQSENNGNLAPLVSLARGQWISEAGIWVKWEHCGNLTTVGVGARYLDVDADKFAEKVKNFENALLSAKRYARMFVDYMNSDVQCTDLLELDIEQLNIGKMYSVESMAESMHRDSVHSSLSVKSWRSVKQKAKGAMEFFAPFHRVFAMAMERSSIGRVSFGRQTSR